MRLSSAITFTAALALAVSLFVCASAPASGPALVTVRVEGSTETVLGTTRVLTTAAPVIADGNPEHACPGYSALGALSLASKGNWSGHWYGGAINNGKFEGLGYAVESILGESYAFPSESFWDFWFNHRESQQGLCETEGESGAEVLLFPCPAAAAKCPTPLALQAPAVAQVGEPTTVTVIGYKADGTSAPVEGASLSGGASTVTTDDKGHAVVSFPSIGYATLRASAPEMIRDELSVCVHNGNDGTCGTSAPPGSPASAPATLEVGAAHGSQPPSTGPYALVASLTSVRNGYTYKRASAPRLLAGTILARSPVSSVQLKLRREYRRRCSAYNATRGRFLAARCGTGHFFSASPAASFSYLLPKRLGPGRYVLDVQALDSAGNHTTLARGSSRAVFYVR